MNTKSARFFCTVCLAIALMAGKVSSNEIQEDNKVNKSQKCTVDLSVPGQMSDIVSNALVRGFGKNPKQVSDFLQIARSKYKTGRDLAIAAAKAFKVKEKTLLAAIEDYRHCNCKHKGGGAVSKTFVSLEKSDGKITDFSQRVLLHVILHELGHALVREFDLPILGNEETLADAFATHYLVTKMPNRALPILEARISSLMIEAKEIPRTQWTVKGEHNSDARRAYQICALALAHDSNKFKSLARIVDMNESDIKKATDYGSEIHRSWRRMLRRIWMPAGQKSKEARVIVETESVFANAIVRGSLKNDVQQIIRTFDWHSQVTIRFEDGEGGAGWNRSRRTVTVFDEYINRFNNQSRLIPSYISPQ